MANVYWHLDPLSGSTLTLRLYPLTSGTIANAGGDEMAESGDGLFVANVAEDLDGWHKAYADRNGAPVATGWVDMTNGQHVVNEAVIDLSAFPPAVVVGRYTDSDADSPTITCKVGELGVVVAVSVTDSNGDAVDLTDWGAKQVVIERANSRTDVQVVDNGDITISGVGNDTFSFTPSAAVLADKGDFKWSLREVSTGDVIIDGRLTVSYSPLEDA